MRHMLHFCALITMTITGAIPPARLDKWSYVFGTFPALLFSRYFLAVLRIISSILLAAVNEGTAGRDRHLPLAANVHNRAAHK